MPKQNYNILTEFNSKFLFDIVSDVESYPEFLPWVSAVRVEKVDGEFLFL